MSENYTFTDDMAEVSGLGGDYERACRDMVIAGAVWLDRHEDDIHEKLQFKEYKNVVGVIQGENDISEDLLETMAEAAEDAGGAPTGAMMHATARHVAYIAQNGWEDYVAFMEDDEDA